MLVLFKSTDPWTLLSQTMHVPLADLPNDARVWLFAVNRDLSDNEQTELLDRLEPFLGSWSSHNRPVPSAADVRADRVLLVAAHIDAESLNAGVSGCGIDKMEAAVELALSELNLERAGPLSVLYRSEGVWTEASRADFRALARSGSVTPEALVLDLTPRTLGGLRKSGIEKPARLGWHREMFRKVEA